MALRRRSAFVMEAEPGEDSGDRPRRVLSRDEQRENHLRRRRAKGLADQEWDSQETWSQASFSESPSDRGEEVDEEKRDDGGGGDGNVDTEPDSLPAEAQEVPDALRDAAPDATSAPHDGDGESTTMVEEDEEVEDEADDDEPMSPIVHVVGPESSEGGDHGGNDMGNDDAREHTDGETDDEVVVIQPRIRMMPRPKRRTRRMRYVNANPNPNAESDPNAFDSNGGRDDDRGDGRAWHTHMTSSSSWPSPNVSRSESVVGDDNGGRSDGSTSHSDNENPPGKKRKGK